MSARAAFHGPLGRLTLSEEDGVITRLTWGGLSDDEPNALLAEAIRQLHAYFERRLTEFDLPLDCGTGFNADVRRSMAAIPYGETRTYGDLAKELAAPAQAIGQACGANTIPVIIPCHRILASNGLGGFSAPGGIETKVALLKLEGAASLLI